MHVHRFAGLVGLSLAVSVVAGLSGVVPPTGVQADTGNTNTIKVLGAPTISPEATGGSFTVNIVVNASVSLSGAGAGLQFDHSKLQVTAIAKDATEVANQVSYLGYPLAANLTTFLANANSSGQIPNISWTYLDGVSAELANTDHGIYAVTFKVTALGDSTLTPNDSPTILDGTVATYGAPLGVTTVNGTVVNSALPSTASITPLAAWLASNTVAVRWGGTGTGPLTYDVRYRKAPYNTGAFGALAAWQSGAAATTANFTTSPGFTYCFSARTHGGAGVSSWTAETCTAAPLDDRSLTRSGSWSAKTGSAYYRSTVMYSTSSGAKLARTGVKVKRIAIVATTCSTCGSIRVYLGSRLLKTISLRSTTTVNKRIFLVSTFTSLTAGTFSVSVYGSGRKVYIDGVVLSAR